MSTTPPPSEHSTTATLATLVSEPPKPSTRTVVVTTRPALIPDEESVAYCLTRRNVFDAVIALILVVGIIYLVFYWRKARPFTGLTRAMNTGTGFGRTGASGARGLGQGQGLAGIGRQIAGALRKFLK